MPSKQRESSKDAVPSARALSRMLRSLSRPQRLRRDPYAQHLVAVFALEDPSQLAPIVALCLQRLPERQRVVIGRYEIGREPTTRLIQALAISRRQFFRDRDAALNRLLEVLPSPAPSRERVNRPASIEPVLTVAADRWSLERSAILGLRYAGAADVAVERLHRILPTLATEAERRSALLEIGEIAMEYGDRHEVERVTREIASAATDDEVGQARLLSLQADLAARTDESAAVDLRAAELLRRHTDRDDARTLASVVAFLECLRLLATDYQRASQWDQARRTLAEAMHVVTLHGLEAHPTACALQGEAAYHDGLQFGRIADGLERLARLLDHALSRGWFTVAAETGAMILHLSVMRSRYAEAVAWYRWLFSCSLPLPEWQRQLALSETAHALTMLGRPKQALTVLSASRATGPTYPATVKIFQAEAHEALGDFRSGLRTARAALTDSERARFPRGIARSKRVMARCLNGLGRPRNAQKHLSDALELCENAETTYDLLRTRMASASVVRHAAQQPDMNELLRLMIEAGGDRGYLPPSMRPR